ncbi:MFS transporter [Kiloniella laminariae]|uniref:MFS transporter n=1 Tax=Kiloniella laminariae TaxID=454162 RepID=UPI00037F2D50|nr:MFS transporter [Kiloniella laminariae]
MILRVFLPFALGYFLSFLLRVVNAVIAPDLVSELDLDASDLGLMTSTFFIAFAATQLPLGLLLDRYGPRKVESLLMLFTAAGCLLFFWAEAFPLLLLGRAMIGFGVSACMMAAFKAYVSWVPKERLPLINGCHLAAGGLGAIAGTAPVEFLAGEIGWRGIFLVFAGLSVVISFLIYFVIPRRGEIPPLLSAGQQFREYGQIFRSRYFWRIAPFTIMSQAAFFALQALWSGPWLRDVAGLERDLVASTLGFIAIAVFAGFLVGGFLTDWLRRHQISPITVGCIGMQLCLLPHALLLVADDFSYLQLSAVWMSFALFGTGGYLVYPGLSQHFPADLAGRVNTGLNSMVFTMAFAAQWVVGEIIELWPLQESGGYAVEGYQAGIILLLCAQILAVAWYYLQPLIVNKTSPSAEAG